MANPFCYVELHTNDKNKAKEFYGKLLDWEWQDHPVGDQVYSMFLAGEGANGGITTLGDTEHTPSHWLPYILVDDVADAAERARGLGAKILVEKQEVPEMGWFGVIKDPTGAVVALWENAQKE